MSKINVDEIKVGDLIQRYSGSQGKFCVGVFTRLAGNRVYAYWSDFKRTELWTYREDITDHWKVINFEEETKMDELKVYTGKETIEALLEGKTLKTDNGVMYKLDDAIKVSHEQATGWVDGSYSIDYFIKNEFTEVATPQVGDWVRVKHLGDLTQVAQINDIDGDAMWADWRGGRKYYKVSDVDWEILSPEQVSEYKREQAFVKVGRKPNEFKPNDIVFVNSLGITAIVISNSNNQEVRLHQINHGAKGYTAKPHQLRPISFVEHQVSLD